MGRRVYPTYKTLIKMGKIMKRKVKRGAVASRKNKQLTTAELKKLYAGLQMADERLTMLADGLDAAHTLDYRPMPNWIKRR